MCIFFVACARENASITNEKLLPASQAASKARQTVNCVTVSANCLPTSICVCWPLAMRQQESVLYLLYFSVYLILQLPTNFIYLSIHLSMYLFYRARCAFIRMQWAAPWQSLKLPFQQLISYASLKRSVLSVLLSLSHSFFLPLSVCLSATPLALSLIRFAYWRRVRCLLSSWLCTCKSVR